MLLPRQLIPIPDRNDHRPEYPTGRHVLALYPGTTCFYKAIVVVPPSKVTHGRGWGGDQVVNALTNMVEQGCGRNIQGAVRRR
jgi:hypothetical protein